MLAEHMVLPAPLTDEATFEITSDSGELERLLRTSEKRAHAGWRKPFGRRSPREEQDDVKVT